MKLFTLLAAFSFITYGVLRAQSGPEISFWDTTITPATLRLPPLIRTDVRQANNNPALLPNLDTSTLRLRIDAIRRGNLVINHELRNLIITRAADSNELLTQEQIDLLVEYYPNIRMLYFNNITLTAQAIQAIAAQFTNVKNVVTTQADLTTQELLDGAKKLQGLLEFFGMTNPGAGGSLRLD